MRGRREEVIEWEVLGFMIRKLKGEGREDMISGMYIYVKG